MPETELPSLKQRLERLEKAGAAGNERARETVQKMTDDERFCLATRIESSSEGMRHMHRPLAVTFWS